MNFIIQYLLTQNQYLLQVISFLFNFICKYIPLRRWIFDDSNSPEYQKFKVDEPPLIIGLTNDDAVSAEFRPFKQLVERLNRTFKASYRVKCGFDNLDGASYDLALWVAYYNFLRPHSSLCYRVLNKVDILESADNMPGKWQLLIYLGQKTIAQLQTQQTSA